MKPLNLGIYTISSCKPFGLVLSQGQQNIVLSKLPQGDKKYKEFKKKLYGNSGLPMFIPFDIDALAKFEFIKSLAALLSKREMNAVIRKIENSEELFVVLKKISSTELILSLK